MLFSNIFENDVLLTKKILHSCKLADWCWWYCCNSQPFFVVVCFINYCPFIQDSFVSQTNFFVWNCRQYHKYFATWLFRVFQRIIKMMRKESWLNLFCTFDNKNNGLKYNTMHFCAILDVFSSILDRVWTFYFFA